MNGESFLLKMNDIDADLLLDAAAPARKRRIFGIGRAAIAACLVLLLGTAAYASGILDAVFQPGPVGESWTYREVNGVPVEGDEVHSLIPSVPSSEIKGNVTELSDVIGRQLEAMKNGTFAPDLPAVQFPDSYTKLGLSAKEALKYIGCEDLETPWFPYKDQKAMVTASGAMSEDGKECRIFHIEFEINNVDENGELMLPKGTEGLLAVRSFVWIDVDDEEGHRTSTGISWTELDKHEVIKSRHGYECHIVWYDRGSEQLVFGTAIKKNLVYDISIMFSENNRAEAERIVREWAKHF